MPPVFPLTPPTPLPNQVYAIPEDFDFVLSCILAHIPGREQPPGNVFPLSGNEDSTLPPHQSVRHTRRRAEGSLDGNLRTSSVSLPLTPPACSPP